MQVQKLIEKYQQRHIELFNQYSNIANSNNVELLLVLRSEMKQAVDIVDDLLALQKPTPIELTNQEKKWIKLCKLAYKHLPEYADTNGDALEHLKVFYKQDYAIDPDTHYNTFLDSVFYLLFSTYLKIREDGYNNQMMEFFEVIFKKDIIYNQELPIERAICKLWGMIQSTRVMDNGTERFNLDTEQEVKQLK